MKQLIVILVIFYTVTPARVHKIHLQDKACQLNETLNERIQATGPANVITERPAYVNNTEQPAAAHVTTTEQPADVTTDQPADVIKEQLADVTTTDQQADVTTEQPADFTELNPCLREDPVKPDFSFPGRRISEAKCYEYMWDLNYLHFQDKKYFDCRKYKLEQLPSTVVHGRKALWGEFPHMAAIGWMSNTGGWSFKCGATLISPNFVLTAAHCTKVTSRDITVTDAIPKIVRFVDLIYKELYIKDHPIARIIVHPQYKPPKQIYDIALMKLENDVHVYNKLHPACLWGSSDIASLGRKAVLTGWGATKDAPNPVKYISDILQVGEVDFIDSQTCDELLRPRCNRKQCGIMDHQICAGLLEGGVDTCYGDSGGPLQVKIPPANSTVNKMYYVVGVTSYGFRCGLPNSPGVYTRVSSFIDWIENIVWPQ